MRMSSSYLSSLSPAKQQGARLHGAGSAALKKPASATGEFRPPEMQAFAGIKDVSVSKTSAGHGWRNAYLSVQTLAPFAGRFAASSSLLISVVNSGSAHSELRICGENQQIEAAPGSISIIPDATPFDCNLKTRVGTTHLYIRRELLDQIASDLCKVGPHRVDITPRLAIFDPVLEQLVNAVRDALDDRPDLAGLYVDYLLGAIAARMIQNHSNFAADATPYTQQERLSARLLERTRRLIEEKLDERLTITELAADTGLGPDQFGRLFKQAAGVTLHQFVIRCRIDRACRLLTETNDPIVQIAFDCGFADQVHLTRAFARIVGTTPAVYRKERKR